MSEYKAPAESTETLIEWGVDNLNSVIAIDSQSDEHSSSIPSSEGQKVLSSFLEGRFQEWGFQTEKDDNANLLVHLPSNLPEGHSAPKIAMMVHLDTSQGTFPIPQLLETPAWDGSKLSFPGNDRLHVSQEVYPETACFMGEDLLHGTGVSPVGLDNKLGMTEIMTLAQVLKSNPEIPHGDIYLVFRPDEEIGRMEAVEGLADTFVKHGITHGYTIDGLDPFEINVENFNASRARVTIQGTPLKLDADASYQLASFELLGVKSHGATAKAEGYKNAIVLFAEAMAVLHNNDASIPVSLVSNPVAEVNATLQFLLKGADEHALSAAQASLVGAFEAVLAPHLLRGGLLRAPVVTETDGEQGWTDAFVHLASHINTFLKTPGVSPLLSEESEGYEGYTNPYFVTPQTEGGLVLDYRIRAFSPEERAAREAHVEGVCVASAEAMSITCQIEQQYINMGPALADFPELVTWAEAAAKAIDIEPLHRPIRGGTGVDPFLTRNIPIANLGTGYFAPESEKEFTSKQTLAKHILWLVHLVQVVASH